MRLIYYALGSGAGHIIRSLAVLRALEEMGELEEATMLVSSTIYKKLSDFIPENVQIIEVSRGSFERRRKSISELLITLLSQKYDFVLVDTFPYGLYLELKDLWTSPDANKKKWIFIFRRLLQPFEDEILQAIENQSLPYKRIIVPNSKELRTLKIDSHAYESLVEKVPIDWVGQILAKPSYENETKASGTPLLCHTGKKIETSILKNSLTEHYSGDYITYDKESFTYPLTSFLEKTSFVCGAAGYNLINELAYLGTPALIYPFPREFDDQFSRLEAFSSKYPNLISMKLPNWWEKLNEQIIKHENGDLASLTSYNKNNDKDFQGALKIAQILLSEINS